MRYLFGLFVLLGALSQAHTQDLNELGQEPDEQLKNEIARLPETYSLEPTRVTKTYEKQTKINVVDHHVVEHVYQQ